jgi:hypothetical protein
MAFKTFAPGVLTSSDVNTFLMRQAVITCTSSTRPASPSEGMTIYETDTDFLLSYSGSNWLKLLSPTSWTSFTPTIQNFSIGDGILTARYAQIGRTVLGTVQIVFGSTTSITGTPFVVYPTYPAVSPTYSYPMGALRCVDDSLNVRMNGVARAANGVITPTVFTIVGSRVSDDDITATTPFTWAVNDTLAYSFVYEGL